MLKIRSSTLLLVLAISPVLTRAAQPTGRCEREARHLSSFERALENFADVIENPIKNYDNDRVRLHNNMQKVRLLVGAIERDKPSHTKILENTDAIIEALSLLVHYEEEQRFQKIADDEVYPGISSGMSRAFNYLWKKWRDAVHSQEVPIKQMQSTVRLEAKNQLRQTIPASSTVRHLDERVEQAQKFISGLEKDPEYAMNADLDLISSMFELRDLQAWFKKHEWTDFTLSYFMDLEQGDAFVPRDSLRQLLIVRRMAREVGLADLDVAELDFLHQLKTFTFTEFLKYFPNPDQFSEQLYVAGAKGAYEKAIVRSVFKDSDFKLNLFKATPPPLKDEHLPMWLSFAPHAKVQSHLANLKLESSRVQQVANRYLKDSSGHTLQQLTSDVQLQMAYGDEIYSALIRLAVDNGTQLKDPELKLLARLKRKVTARFFSRRPEDLNLGRRTGDCTSFRSDNFSNSIRWFANTSGQLVTFHAEGHFLGKAHVLLFDTALVVDAFEINPQADVNQPLHKLLTRNMKNIFDELNFLATRLERKLFVAAVTNTEFVHDYITNLKPADDDAISKSKFSFDEKKVDDFLIATSRIQIESAPEGDVLGERLFFQAISYSNTPRRIIQDDDEDEPSLRSEVNREFIQMFENRLKGRLAINRKGEKVKSSALLAYRFHDLPTQDAKLDAVSEYFKPTGEYDGGFEEEDDVDEFKRDFYRLTNTLEAKVAASAAGDLVESFFDDLNMDPDVRRHLIGIYPELKDFSDEEISLMMQHRLFYLFFFKRYEVARSGKRETAGPGWFSTFDLYER